MKKGLNYFKDFWRYGHFIEWKTIKLHRQTEQLMNQYRVRKWWR